MKQATRLCLLLGALVLLTHAAQLRKPVQKATKKDEQLVQCNIPDWTGGECAACRPGQNVAVGEPVKLPQLSVGALGSAQLTATETAAKVEEVSEQDTYKDRTCQQQASSAISAQA